MLKETILKHPVNSKKFEKSFFCEMFEALGTNILKKFFKIWIFLKSRSLPFRKTWCEYKTGQRRISHMFFQKVTGDCNKYKLYIKMQKSSVTK